MEKKVIKFSLVGVICVLLIIVVGIVLTVSAINAGKKEKVDKSDTKTQVTENKKSSSKEESTEKKESSTKETSKENKKENKKETTEYKDSIIVNGEKQEVELKKYKSELGYKMAYDINSFYIQHLDIDEYKSLLTDTIYINISKKTGNYAKVTEELVNATDVRVKKNSSYTLSQNDLNGKKSVKEMETDSAGVTLINYYIDAGNGEDYFAINVVCGKEIKDYTLAIVDKMVSTFEVI